MLIRISFACCTGIVGDGGGSLSIFFTVSDKFVILILFCFDIDSNLSSDLISFSSNRMSEKVVNCVPSSSSSVVITLILVTGEGTTGDVALAFGVGCFVYSIWVAGFGFSILGASGSVLKIEATELWFLCDRTVILGDSESER